MAIQMGQNAENPVDFEDALTAAGSGKFQYKIVLVGGFALLCSYIAISGVAFVLPASQCDLHLTSNDKGNLISAGFLGIALSCHLWGFLSDTLGRHYVLSRCLLADGLLYVITSITPNFSLMLLWRFCNGFASCGGIVSLYAYVGEFHVDKTRLKALMVMSWLASVTYFILPAFAWLILPGKWSFMLYPGLIYNSWRLYYACNGVPSLICSFLLVFLPESPKFLLAKGRHGEALEVLQRIHKENSKDKQDNFLIKYITLNELNPTVKVDDNSNKVMAFFRLMWNQTIPLFKPPHRSSMILVCLTQYLLYLSNGGIYLWLPETLNRLANFKNEFGDVPATYCNVIQHKNELITLNFTEDNLLITPNDSVLVNHSKSMFLQDDLQQLPVCKNDIDFTVYLYLGVLGLTSSSCLLVGVTLSSFFDKKIIIEFFILLSLVSAVCLLLVDVLEIIPMAANVMVALSGTSIPLINSMVVDLFPTNVRAMASCFTLMCSRLGTVTTNAIAGKFLDSYCPVLLWSFIVSFIVSFICVILLPSKPQYLKEEKKGSEEI